MRSLLEGITSTLRSAQQHQTGWDPRNATSTGVPTTAQEAFSGGVPAVAQRDLSHVEGPVSSKGGAPMDCITGYSRFSTHSPPDFPFRMLMITQNVGAIGDTAAGAKEGGEEHRRECEKQAGNDELSSDAQKDVREFLSELRLLIFEYSRREYTAHIRVSNTGDDDPSHPSAADIGGQGPPPLIDVIVVHFQEIGGKSFHTEFNNYFANALQELLPEAGWTSGLLMRTNDDEDQFTAVGSVVYLSHRMCPISSILSFHHRTFVCVGDDPVTYGSSPTILFHGGKFSGAGESRKGYLLISLRLGTVVVNFLNVHLYNDKKSKEAAAASPSPYALQRQEALLETLAECAAFISPDDPLFIFGDFNTRLDVHNMLQYLKEVENLDVKVSDGDVRAPDSFWELFENPQHMGVIRPYDVEVQRLLDVVAQQSGMELAEFAVRFPPTYLCQSPRDSEEATFQIDTPVHLVNDGEDKRESGTSDRISVVRVLERLSSMPHHPYGRRRVPAWCDRVLWNPPALELMTGRRTSQSVAGSSATAHGGTGVGALRRVRTRVRLGLCRSQQGAPMADGAEGCPLRRYSAVDSSENIVNRNKTYPGDSQSPHLHEVVPAQTEGIPPFLSRRSWEAGVPYHGEVVSRDVSQSRSVGPKSQPSTEATRSTTTMRSCALNASESFDVENVLPPVRKRAVSLRNPRRAGDQDFGKPGSDISASPAAATWSVAAPASHCSNRGTRMGRSSSYSELLPVGNAACGCGRVRVSSLRDLLQHYGSPDVGKDAGDATLPEVWGGASKYIPKLPRQPACSVFGLFSMMERDRFESFAALFKRHRQLLEPFVEHVVDQCPPLFPDVVNIVEFLRNPSDAPGEYFFDYSLVAWPFSVLYAASCFYVTAKQHGYRNLFDILRLRGGLLTCGKDVLAALAIAMSPTEEDLLRNVSNMYHAAFFVGSVYIDDERCLETHVRKCSNCSFALLLVNITIPCLQLLVERINQVQIFSRARYDRTEGPTACVIPLSKVEITRVISTRCAIVCGNPVDLERLDILVLRYACAAGIKVHKEFLPIFTPENSLFYNQSKHLQLLQLWSDNGVELDASSMHLTVYSPVDGKPWSSESIGSLLDEVARAVTCSSHDLTHSLQQLQNGDVLLDFSATEPGIGKLVEWEQRDVVVLSEPADVVALNILSTPRRGRAKHVMESTLNKCAVINDILKVISWECEPRLAYTETLSCTFVDFGLVMKRPETGREINECYQRLCEVSHPVTGTCTSCGVPSVNCLWEDVMATQEQSCGLPEYIVVANGQPPGAVGVHQVSPTVKYYEVQSGCVLLQTGVEFTRRLSHYTRLPFPPHTLLMCPTVLDLIHLWETYEFLGGRAPTNLA